MKRKRPEFYEMTLSRSERRLILHRRAYIKAIMNNHRRQNLLAERLVKKCKREDNLFLLKH